MKVDRRSQFTSTPSAIHQLPSIAFASTHPQLLASHRIASQASVGVSIAFTQQRAFISKQPPRALLRRVKYTPSASSSSSFQLHFNIAVANMARKLSVRAAAQREKLNKQNSPLLKIPAEVREDIFIRVVAEEEPLSIVPPELGYSKKADTLVTHPPLCWVSRQCRREATPLFYSENTFQLRCKLRVSPHLQ